MKKKLYYIITLGTFVMSTQIAFGAIYAEVKTGGAVAYATEGGLIASMPEGEQVTVVKLGEDKDVYTIKRESRELEVDKEALHIRKIIETIEAPGVKVRKEPDPDSPMIKMMAIGEQVSVLYRTPNQNWYQVVLEDGREGFIYRSQLMSEGLDLLPEKDLNKPKVEELQWSEASKVFPRGAVATIEDVYTGKTFKIKRTFGTNHADVEALTKADTAMIKEIWGGFTWERRPVIVHINGRRLAASLAGMPHAGSSLDGVPNNGMSGVIDLHFRGSRKHAEGNITATPDPLHQNAISIAAKYQ